MSAIRLQLVYLLGLLTSSAQLTVADQPANVDIDVAQRERVTKLLKTDRVVVTLSPAKELDASASLEIGDGAGHGGSLRWLRFEPARDGVDVLSIALERKWKQYKSKWPTDEVPIKVTKATIKRQAYTELLRDIAAVQAAKLSLVPSNSATVSSQDFWVYARVSADGKPLIDLNWAGYHSDRAAMEFGKPQAVVRLARDVLKNADPKEDSLTVDERRWASEKFIRDWKRFENLEFHWWVCERYIEMIGVVGDKTALPTLVQILKTDSKERDAYYAINAVTRLTKNDVREKPVEEMDVEKSRQRILAMLSDKK